MKVHWFSKFVCNETKFETSDKRIKND